VKILWKATKINLYVEYLSTQLLILSTTYFLVFFFYILSQNHNYTTSLLFYLIIGLKSFPLLKNKNGTIVTDLFKMFPNLIVHNILKSDWFDYEWKELHFVKQSLFHRYQIIQDKKQAGVAGALNDVYSQTLFQKTT
jgi:hypothetical protein